MHYELKEMDYKYIEQLLERYWECQTTLEEEAILRKFFAQSDIPASLLPYASLFQVEEDMAKERLSDDFDERLMKRLADEHIQNQQAEIVPLTWTQRLRPLWRAVASVAIVLTIGMAVQQGFERSDDDATDDVKATTAQSDVTLPGDSTEVISEGEVLEAVLTPAASDSLAAVTTTK